MQNRLRAQALARTSVSGRDGPGIELGKLHWLKFAHLNWPEPWIDVDLDYTGAHK